jgi:hypothetical protein
MLLSALQVDQIMHIMYAAVHSGIPYIEDYYYQAFVNRHGKGRNAAAFQPEVGDTARLVHLCLSVAAADGALHCPFLVVGRRHFVN